VTIGVLGAGQLGWMLALAGQPLGLRFRFLDPSGEAPAGRIAPLITADYNDLLALERFARGLDRVTYEFENVPVASALFLQQKIPVYPPPRALETAQDRLNEKEMFQLLDIPVPPFAPVSSADEFAEAVQRVGLPGVLKTRRMGYDGKGQAVIRSRDDVPDAWDALGNVPLIYERFVEFERELSILAVRGCDGGADFYPLVENHHAGGILRRSLAPAPLISPKAQSIAEEYARRALTQLGYVGALAIEFFQTRDGLLANEMAPRVHNSGHWSIEGAETSQFENHVRAVAGLPLGSTEISGCSAMLNLIGSTPDPAAILAVPFAHLHHYGKAPRPGRKLGHVTLRAPDYATLNERLSRLAPLIECESDV